MTRRLRNGIRPGAGRAFAVSAAGFILVASLAGCASTLPVAHDAGFPAAAAVDFETSGKSWWKVGFYVAWDRNEAPDWHVDALLADQVMKPIVTHVEARLPLWRFHRRAGHDESGHQFSFLFYGDRDTAQIINNGVHGSAMAARLVDAGVIRDVDLAQLDGASETAIGATSDPVWPAPIMRGWPWFIMGASQSWLRLIEEVKSTRPPPQANSVASVLDYYREVHKEVSALWRDHGQHAYLHHLNAIFGYQPLVIRETNLKRF